VEALACFIVRLFVNLQEKDRIIQELQAQKQVTVTKGPQSAEGRRSAEHLRRIKLESAKGT